MYRIVKLAMLAVPAIALGLGACKKSDNRKSSGGATTQISQPIAATQTQTIGTQGFSQQLIANPRNANDEAINNCLRNFGSHPFTASQLQSYREIKATYRVFGIGRGIVDQPQTSGPELVLITNSLNALGVAKYSLLNPNGYYCIKQGVNVLAKTKVELQCSAKLSDSKTSLTANVQNPGASQGVSVSPKIEVTKVGC